MLFLYGIKWDTAKVIMSSSDIALNRSISSFGSKSGGVLLSMNFLKGFFFSKSGCSYFYFTRLRSMIKTMFQIIQLANKKQVFKEPWKQDSVEVVFAKRKKSNENGNFGCSFALSKKGKEILLLCFKKVFDFFVLLKWTNTMPSLSLTLSLILSYSIYLSVSSAPCVCSEQQKFSSKRRARNVKRHNCRSVGWLLEVCFAQTELFRQQLKLAKFT